MAVPKAFITDTELDLLKVLWSDQPPHGPKRSPVDCMGKKTPPRDRDGTQKLGFSGWKKKSIVVRDRREPGAPLSPPS